MNDKVRIKANEQAHLHGLWCEGCRQMPTMSIERVKREKDKPHEMCPAGTGTWRLVALIRPKPKRKRAPKS